MCIRRETREKARRSLAFSRVSKPHTHITHMLRQCTSIVYELDKSLNLDTYIFCISLLNKYLSTFGLFQIKMNLWISKMRKVF